MSYSKLQGRCWMSRAIAALTMLGLTVIACVSSSTGFVHAGDEEGAEDGGTLSGDPLVLGRPGGAGGAGFGWVSPETNYKVDPVECNGVDIGRIDFKYRTYRNTNFNPDVGGAALEGGFTADGGDPCLFGQQPGTEYFWIQTIITNRPLPGRGPGEYVDSNNPRTDPAYPHQSGDHNPSNDPFTGRSYYDAPRRSEEAARNINWLAENILCCRVNNKINVIGSFLWGYDIVTDGAPNDGNVNVTANPRHAWGAATDSAIDTVAKESKGTKTEQGWSVSAGCCCNKWWPLICFSDSVGICDLPFMADPSMIIDMVVVFPRNHPVIVFSNAPPGWIPQPWGSTTAPVLPYQTIGSTMFQEGILFTAMPPQPMNGIVNFPVRVAAHESFFDVFVHDLESGHWIPWTMRSQELLGDMNGDDVVDFADFPAWQLAFTNPVSYAANFPGLNPLFRGDLTHNGMLDPVDGNMLQQIINTHLNADAQQEGPPCPADLNPNDGDGVVGVPDLLGIINKWGPCIGCPEDHSFDGQVGVPDLLFVINSWGPCE